jgi:phospholipase/carboxylesterase
VLALRLEGESLFEQAPARFGVGVGAHAVEALECELPRDLRLIRGQRRVVGLHHRDLEPEALRVLEAETGVGALRRDVLGGESLLPEGERFLGADAEDDAVHHPGPCAAAAGVWVFEEGQVASRAPLFVGVEEVVDGRVVLVHRFLDEPEAEDANVEVDVARSVGGDARDVVDTLELHQPFGLYRGGHDPRMALTARVRPAAGEPEGALVLFHGRGADEDDLFPLLDALDPERRLVGATPRGPLSLPPGGAHWYVLGGIGTPEAQTFGASYAAAAEWLEDFLGEQGGVAYDRLVLGGFSQGGVMSYALGLGKGRPRPAALTVFSSFIPRVDGIGFDLSPPLPPVAIGHGTLDPVIGVEWGRQAREVLEAAGAEVLYRETPMGHQIDPSFVGEVAEWLRGIIPPRG